MRQRPVPWAYRVFFRHIGLDPDEHRTPVEALALERLKAGGFSSRSLLDDALTIAVMETGVPVWALDADRIEGELALRPAGARRALRRRASTPPTSRPGGCWSPTTRGRSACCSARSRPGAASGPETTRMTLFSVQVAGVPDIHVEEALWTVADILGR